MAVVVSTVTRNQGSDKRSNGRSWLRRRDERTGSTAQPEHSTFPRPEAQTQILPPVRPPFTPSEDARWVLSQVRRLVEADREHAALAKQKASSIPGAPANSHPGYLLHYLAILALDLEVVADLTFCEAVERLRMTMEEFSARALAEQALGRRNPGHVEAVRRVGETIDAAAAAAAQLERATGERVDLTVDLTGLAGGMARLADNASNLSDETMHGLPVITDDMPDPRLAKPVEVTQVLANGTQFPPFGQDDGHTPHPEVVEPGSPVHPAEEPAPVPPAVPAEHEPLPQRKPPPVSFPAVMVGEPGDAALRDGTLMVAKRLVEGFEDMWILHEDGVHWAQIADVSTSNSTKTVYVKLADGRKLEVHADREVLVLSADEAKSLLADAQSGGTA
jgi:hypothetical protein